MLDLDFLYKHCMTWTDDFIPAARPEYNDLLAGAVGNSDIPQERAQDLAYNSTVLRLLAGCHHDWTKDGSDWKALAALLQEAPLKLGSDAGTLLVDAGGLPLGAFTGRSTRSGGESYRLHHTPGERSKAIGIWNADAPGGST